MHYGENLHHIAEAVFKAVGRALARSDAPQPPHHGHPIHQGNALTHASGNGFTEQCSSAGFAGATSGGVGKFLRLACE